MAKPEGERPLGCRFWTSTDIIYWLNDHLPAGKSRVEAALWWKANLDADSMSDLNRREWAEMCLDGLKATDLDDVTDELQAPHLDDEPHSMSISEIDAAVELQLRDFFGLNKEG